MQNRDHEISIALAKFTTFVIDKFDTKHESAKNQTFVKGVFSGASCRSLVGYAKEMRELAYKNMSLLEIAQIEKRSHEGINSAMENNNERS